MHMPYGPCLRVWNTLLLAKGRELADYGRCYRGKLPFSILPLRQPRLTVQDACAVLESLQSMTGAIRVVLLKWHLRFCAAGLRDLPRSIHAWAHVEVALCSPLLDA